MPDHEHGVEFQQDTMYNEPAKLIAKVTEWKNALVMLAAVLGIVISPELSGSMDTLIEAAIVVGMGLWSIYAAWSQGKETRDRVYSPSTHVREVENAAKTGIPRITKVG